jgi:butyryl-CoA dehydrogenase
MTSMITGNLLAELAKLARQADEVPVWPEASWHILEKLGGLRWAIPRDFGGDGFDGVALLEHYEQLAGACLTTCFILSQRDAAVRRLRDHGNEAFCRELLPPLANGSRFMTVGLAQLTTSRQHGRPVMTARPASDGYVIDGVIPWCTGAVRAEHIIMGAVVEGKGPFLAVLPMNLSGITVSAPMELMALQGSLTAEVRCQGVHLKRRHLLAGPGEGILQQARGAPGGLETSCLALGLAGAAIAFLRDESTTRPELARDADRLDQTRHKLHAELHALAGGTDGPKTAQALRARANALVLQATQAALTASKGSGFLRSHPAQRWARQAMFFLVWSCPGPVAAATMACLIGDTR